MEFLEILAYMIVASLSMMGILELVRFVSLHILSGSCKMKRFVVYPVGGECEDLELLVRSVYQKSQWEDCGNTETVLLDLGLNEEGRRIVKILQRDLRGFYYCSPSDFNRLIEEKIKLDS